MEVLAILIEEDERRTLPRVELDPIEAIEERMDQQGLTRADLEPAIGSRARVSEILNRRRGMSIEMMRNLSVLLGLPIDVLAVRYDLATEQSPARSSRAAAQHVAEEQAPYKAGTKMPGRKRPR
jgi:HTH-type transcriptional regulator/antitoxin HigA